jgi:S1-C subfamily serine protease
MHVVEDVWKAMHADLQWEKLRKEHLIVVRPTVWVFIQKKKYVAEILHVSDHYDLCIMKIDRAGPSFRLSTASEFPRGYRVSACGYPDQLRTPFPGDEERLAQLRKDRRPSKVEELFQPRDFEFTMTSGSVSRVVSERQGDTWIQHNATISEGNSGGPLMAEDGTVIGINTLGSKAVGIYSSLALPQLREEIDKFVSGAAWK